MAHKDHKGNGHGHVTEIPDVSHIKNVDCAHETSDVNVPALLKSVLALTIMTAVVYVLMLFLFKFLNAQEAQREPPAGPMAMSEQESLPPEPRLQSAPGSESNLRTVMGQLYKREPEESIVLCCDAMACQSIKEVRRTIGDVGIRSTRPCKI